MKTLITFAFASFLFVGHAQDTLNCKKDLTYDSKGQFYYKKGDDSKTPVTGNAICMPKKGMVNKGKLVNGKWHGVVTGYRDNKMIGRAHYKNGLYDGLKICYTDQGKTKDSIIYKEGDMEYAYEADYDKEGNIKCRKMTNYANHTSEMRCYKTVNNLTYLSEVMRYQGGKKNGVQEYMKGESDAPGSLLTYTYEEEKYNNGELVTKSYFNHGKKYRIDDYSDGKLAMQNDIGEDGHVSASYPMKNGKKHGMAIVYSTKGEKPESQEYSKGKLVTKK